MDSNNSSNNSSNTSNSTNNSNNDFIDHWFDVTTSTIDNIANYVYKLNICGCINNGINTLSTELENFGKEVEYQIDNIGRTSADDLRDIANALANNNATEISEMNYLPPSPISKSSDNIETSINNIDVKIRINKDHIIEQIMVKYLASKKYVNVPFEASQNPNYIQSIIDTYFVINGESIITKPILFDELEQYYHDTRKQTRPTSWFKERAGWIKFSSDNHQMKPCGFKRYVSETIESESEN